jgi:hypothetical protein
VGIGKGTWFSGLSFPQKCDDCANTLTFIQTIQGFVFDGFTPIPFDSRSGSITDNAQQSWLSAFVSRPQVFRDQMPIIRLCDSMQYAL